MKRAYNVKDFDSLFPGHGGVTDRMDCQFIMGFFMYVYYTVVISSGVSSVPQLLSVISQLPHEEQLLIFNTLKQTLKL
jgi:phosphatidate cytidylyltransferase